MLDVLRRFGEKVDKVLVIDDDPDFVRLASRILESPPHYCQVLAAYSGREAIELTKHEQPDLVLLDMVLPDIPGAELIERLRASPTYVTCPSSSFRDRTRRDRSAPQGRHRHRSGKRRGDGRGGAVDPAGARYGERSRQESAPTPSVEKQGSSYPESLQHRQQSVFCDRFLDKGGCSHVERQLALP